MIIIPISGKSGSGKDFVATEIKRQLELEKKSVLIVHYADVLKFICTTYFAWNGIKDDDGRALLQKVGTELIRSQDTNFFTRFMIKTLQMFYGQWDFVIIPDARFENEIEYLNMLSVMDGAKVFTLRIERDFESKLTIEQQNHTSETALDNYDFYYTLHNDNSISGVSQEVHNFLEEVKNDK